MRNLSEKYSVRFSKLHSAGSGVYYGFNKFFLNVIMFSQIWQISGEKSVHTEGMIFPTTEDSCNKRTLTRVCLQHRKSCKNYSASWKTPTKLLCNGNLVSHQVLNNTSPKQSIKG